MGKFEREILPKGLLDAQARLSRLQWEAAAISNNLDMDEEYNGYDVHDCDCEYCESNTRDWKRLGYLEREELEKEYNRLEREINDLHIGIGRLIRYKTYVDKVGLNK